MKTKQFNKELRKMTRANNKALDAVNDPDRSKRRIVFIIVGCLLAWFILDKFFG